MIFGFAENQPLPTRLTTLRPSHCEQSEAIFFQNNNFSGTLVIFYIVLPLITGQPATSLFKPRKISRNDSFIITLLYLVFKIKCPESKLP